MAGGDAAVNEERPPEDQQSGMMCLEMAHGSEHLKHYIVYLHLVLYPQPPLLVGCPMWS